MEEINLIQLGEDVIMLLNKHGRLIGSIDEISFSDSLLRDAIINLIVRRIYDGE
jgi:hypothetical protein